MKNKFKKILLLISVILNIVSFSINCHASRTVELKKDSLVADFKFFCKILEETHPDPYTRFGGRPYFYMKRDAYLDRIINDSLGLIDFCNLINEFIIPLQDMHTYVSYPSSDNSEDKFVQRIIFLPLNEGLIVRFISNPHGDLIGSRLISVGGENADTLLARMLKVMPSENKYSNLNNFSRKVFHDRYLKLLGVNFNDSVRYGLVTPKGDTVYVSLPLLNRSQVNNDNLARLTTELNLPKNNLQYTFLNNDNNIMYLKLSSVMARENYKYCYENGWDNAINDIRQYYNSTGKEMPDDMDDAIMGIPSFSEQFVNMLDTMKNNGSEYLIIDLRGNSGGWTSITLPSLMMLYGDEYVSKDMNSKFIRRISDNYLKKLNISLEEFNKLRGSKWEIGDYQMHYETDPELDINKKRDDFILNAMTEKRDLLQNLNGEPLYRPKQIFVITDPGTFSAAFHYAFYLWKMGATIVGVPSSQSTNTYMENTPFQLPYTKLSASSSNSIQQFVEPGSPMERALIPEIEITLEDYVAADFDINTPVLKIIDILSTENHE